MKRTLALLVAVIAVSLAGYFVGRKAATVIRTLQIAGHAREPLPYLHDGEYRGVTAERLSRFLERKYGTPLSEDVVDSETLEPIYEDDVMDTARVVPSK